MDTEKNLAIICDIRSKSPVGIICACPINGDIAYSTKDLMLQEVLEILLDNKIFVHSSEKISNSSMITEDTIDDNDSYYLMALNYSLPFPWRILGVTSAKGDVEQIVEESNKMLTRGGINLEEINEEV